MIRINTYFTVRLMSLFFLSVFLFLPTITSALISNGANANGVLGQYDNSNLPVFTKGGANNGPNNFGFNGPQFVAYDTVGNRIFVSDRSNHRVLVYNTDASGVPIDYLADFVLGQTDLISNTTGLTSSKFNSPTSLTYDTTTSKLYVSDSSNLRIMIFDLSGGITNGMAATNVLGQANFTTATFAVSSSKFNSTSALGLSLDTAGQRLFVAEASSNRVLVFNISTITNGMAATNVIGQTLFTTTTAAVTNVGLSAPQSVTYDSNNNRIFVAQCAANRITVYDASAIANGMTASNVIGQSLFTTSATGLTASSLNCATGVSYDTTNNRLFAVDSTNKRVLTYDGTAIADGMSATNVLGQTDFISNTTGVTQSNFSAGVTSLAYHPGSQSLMVTDSSSNRVLIFDVNAITDGENAVNILGQYDPTNTVPNYTKSATNGGTGLYGFETPIALAVDSVHHRLFVVDQINNRVLVYNLTAGNIISSITPVNVLGQTDFISKSTGVTSSKFNNPNHVFYDSANDRLFVTDAGNNRVLSFDTTSITDGMAANIVIGQPNFTTSGGGTTASKLFSPQATHYDNTSGKLFVSDSSNRRVLIFDGTFATLTSNPTANTVIGQANFTSAVSATTVSGFSSPMGVAYDATHDRLFVSDPNNHRVMIFNGPFTNNMNASNVWGQTNFTTATSGGNATKFTQPRFLTYDSTNNRVLLSDGNNSRILFFDATTITDTQSAVNVMGQTLLTTTTSGTSISKFNFPTYAEFDPISGNVFITDALNNRVITNDGSVSAAAPTIVSVSPVLGTGFATTSSSTIFFSSGVATTSAGTFTFKDYFTGNTVSTLSTNSSVFSMGTTSLKITPYPTLPLGMRLYLEIASNTLTNVGSTTVFSGLIGSSTLYFDTPGAFTFPTSVFNVSENVGTITIPYHWYYTGSGSGQVDYSITGGTAASGVDYATISTTTITKTGITDVTGTISFGILDDATAESTESVIFSFSNPLLFAALGTTTTVTINITDNDTIVSGGGGGGGGGIYAPADQTFTPVQTSTKDSLASKLLKDFTPDQIKNLTPEEINLKYFGADKDGHSTLGLQNCKAGIAATAKYNTKVSPSKIEEIQLFLNSQGEKLRVTGIFHLDDVASVKRFQKKYGLAQTGEWRYSEHDIASSIACGFQLKKINFDNLLSSTTTKIISENTSACNIFDTVLKKFSKNPKNKVKDLQRFLNIEVDAKLPVSGMFGGQTESAVKTFQQKYKEFILLSQSFDSPTGVFHKKSMEKANQIICKEN